MTREEAITALGDRNILLWGMSWEEQKHYSKALDMAISALKKNRGEWIEDEDIDVNNDGKFAVKCSKCGEYNGYRKTNFCPNCGADMRTAKKPETCKGCLEPCIMYEPDMRGCKKKVTDRNEKGEN